MTLCNRAWLAALAAVPFSFAVQADDATPLDPVTITATRSPVAASRVNAAVTVIPRAELARLQAADVGEAVAQIAGLDVIRSGGPGQAPLSVFIRGAESNHTLVLVDGVRLNDGINGLAALESIPLDAIERIEVVKGPRSNQWGSDAIGGVIHIITRASTQQGFGGEVLARYGRFNAQDVGTTLGYRAARGGVQLTAQRQTSDGFPTFVESTLAAGTENLAASLAGDVALGAGTLSARHWQAGGETEYLAFAAATEVSRYDFARRTTSLDYRIAPSARWQTTLAVQLAGDDREEQQPGFGSAPDFFRTARQGLDWQNVLTLGAHELLLGANLADEDTEASVSDARFDETIRSKAVFAQDTVQLGRHTLLASARLTDHDSFGGYTTAAVDYGFALTPAATLGIGYGTAFRAPNASERFLSFPAFGFFANPDLEPETARNLEVSFKARFDAQQTFALHAFENRIRDLITTESDPVSFETTFVNLDRATVRGVEVDYQLAVAGWRLAVTGNAQRAVDDATGERLLRRASRSATAQLAHRWGANSLGVQLQGVASRPDLDFGSFPSQRVKNGGYTLVHLTGEARLTPALTLSARVENALDRRYTTVFGYRQAGAAATGTLRYLF